MQPGTFEFLGVGRHFVMAFAATLQRLKNSFRTEHARLHGGVAALDFREVQETGVVANQAAAGESQLGQGIQATLDHSARTVGNSLGAIQILLYRCHENGCRSDLCFAP